MRLPSRGHSRQAGAQGHRGVSAAAGRWGKTGAQSWELLKSHMHSVALGGKGESAPLGAH